MNNEKDDEEERKGTIRNAYGVCVCVCVWHLLPFFFFFFLKMRISYKDNVKEEGI